MARKTFGRNGQPIIVDGGEAGRIASETGDRFEPVETDTVGEHDSQSVEGNRETEDGIVEGPIGTDPETAAPARTKRKYTKRIKPGDGKSSSTTQNVIDEKSIASVTDLIESLHVMMAVALHVPELAISNGESQRLRDATIELAKAHNFGAVVSPKMLANINFGCAVAGIYGPRVMLVMQKSKREKVTPINASSFTAR
jgi:hypothetical protein